MTRDSSQDGRLVQFLIKSNGHAKTSLHPKIASNLPFPVWVHWPPTPIRIPENLRCNCCQLALEVTEESKREWAKAMGVAASGRRVVTFCMGEIIE